MKFQIQNVHKLFDKKFMEKQISVGNWKRDGYALCAGNSDISPECTSTNYLVYFYQFFSFERFLDMETSKRTPNTKVDEILKTSTIWKHGRIGNVFEYEMKNKNRFRNLLLKIIFFFRWNLYKFNFFFLISCTSKRSFVRVEVNKMNYYWSAAKCLHVVT